ncbi:uncharacterized protein LOC121781399 [Salvia splendens]|uniref:uncharacterized protein LOC121781399 n=1 Tax=Salvia splendens TaxID=180675 RepID=UPI001C2524F2|nr:uncharacterized protein LOC121781399 [Salvia splendens]
MNKATKDLANSSSGGSFKQLRVSEVKKVLEKLLSAKKEYDNSRDGYSRERIARVQLPASTEEFSDGELEKQGDAAKNLLPADTLSPQVDLKKLPANLKCVFLGEEDSYPVIISSSLTEEQETKLLTVLSKNKRAIGCSLTDLVGISSDVCMHHIRLEEGGKAHLDLASKAVGGGEEASTPEAGESDAHIEKDETVVRTEELEPVAPPVSKPKAVKRKLVLKSDLKAERPKPKRVSQRCLGKWTSSKAKANTAADAVEVSSEEERTTPTKPREQSLSTTNLEDASTATEVVTPTPSDQREETDKMAEGLDLAFESVGHDEPRDDRTHIRVETQPTAQDKPSTQIEKRPEEDEDGNEDRYREERKKKGKAPVTKKPSRKKQHTVNAGVVITKPDQRAPPRRREPSDSEYTASEESGSDNDVSL